MSYMMLLVWSPSQIWIWDKIQFIYSSLVLFAHLDYYVNVVVFGGYMTRVGYVVLGGIMPFHYTGGYRTRVASLFVRRLIMPLHCAEH